MHVASEGLRDVVAVARRLSQAFGRPGAAVMAERARALEAEGEFDDACFWREVAHAMRLLDSRASR